MTWKATAVVSGATVLIGWLASSPPSTAPAPTTPAPSQPTAGMTAAGADIERQASRLEARLRQEAEYREPERNPFRFGPPRAVDQPEPTALPPVDAEIPPPLPSPPLVSLAGIAEDRVDDRLDRTAILSSRSGVLLVREGDAVLDRYRVVKIDRDAVELVSVADGESLRLSLDRPSGR